MLLLSQHTACQAAAVRAPHFAAASALLRIWARTQALDCGADGVGGSLLTLVLAHLLLKGAAVRGWGARGPSPLSCCAALPTLLLQHCNMCCMWPALQPRLWTRSPPHTPLLPPSLLQNPGMSAMNLVRTVLVALAEPKTFAAGLFMPRGAGAAGDSSPPDAKAWRRHFEVVFVDASGWLNLAAHVSKAALVQVSCCWGAGPFGQA